MNEDLIARLIELGFDEELAGNYANQMFPDGTGDVEAAVDEILRFAADRFDPLTVGNFRQGIINAEEAEAAGVPRGIIQYIEREQAIQQGDQRAQDAIASGDPNQVQEVAEDIATGEQQASEETALAFGSQAFPPELLAVLGPVSAQDVANIAQTVQSELLAAGYSAASNLDISSIHSLITAAMNGSLPDRAMNDIITGAVQSVPISATVVNVRNSQGQIVQETIARDKYDQVLTVVGSAQAAGQVFSNVLSQGGDADAASYVAAHLAQSGVFANTEAALIRQRALQEADANNITAEDIFGDLFPGAFPEEPLTRDEQIVQYYENKYTPLNVQNQQVYEASIEFQRYADQFGRGELALVAMHDPDLARRVYESTGGPTVEDSWRIRQILEEYEPESLLAAGFDEGSPYVQYMIGGPGGALGGAGGGGGGREITITLPDEQGLREQVRALYQSLMLRDPTEGEEAMLVQQLYSSIRANADYPGQGMGGGADGTAIGSQYNPFRGVGLEEFFGIDPATGQPAGASGGGDVYDEDVSTSITDLTMARLRSDPEFAALYANRPSGVSELDYVRGFQTAATDALGVSGTMNPDIVRAGMLTGDVATTYGRANFSEAGVNSMTLQGRLAQAAAAIARFT